jgi:hypothetical protein
LKRFVNKLKINKMEINFKSTARLTSLSLDVLYAIFKVAVIFESFDTVCTIVGLNDSKHCNRGQHAEGKAFDVRTWSLGDWSINKMAEVIKQELGENFEVDIESGFLHIQANPPL